LNNVREPVKRRGLVNVVWDPQRRQAVVPRVRVCV
jgi:hypothetical protein